MSLGNWLHRHPFLEAAHDSDNAFALANRIRDPFSEAFSDLVNSMARLDNEFGALRGFDKTKFLASFPAYEVDESGSTYKIKVDVPGVKADDLKVELEEDGKVVHISGGRKFEKDGAVTESRFEKRFTLRDSVDAHALTARLEHGVLVLEAPMLKEVKPKTRLIAVSDGSKGPQKLETNSVSSEM